MEFTKLLSDLAFIQKLGDNPNTDNSITADELKSLFDKASLLIQEYLNDVLTKELSEKISELEEDVGNFAVGTGFLPTHGGTMSGAIAMSGNKITGLGKPTDPGDAVPKSALDELTGTVVPVEKGGTGATSVSAALTKLGAVNKAGDTMKGRLILPYLRLNPDSDYPTMEIYSGGSLISALGWNKNTRRVQIRNNCPDTDYREVFSTPSADSNLTEDKYYELLTNKSPVTVAQGGTGASTAAGARENLGVSGALKLTAVWTNSSPESAFAAQTLALSEASGLDVAFWIVEYRGLASDTGSVLNTIAFPGHGTVSHYHIDSKIMSRNVEFSGTSAVFKGCSNGTAVENTYLVPYRIYAVHKA